jgi:hypothetical protein
VFRFGIAPRSIVQRTFSLNLFPATSARPQAALDAALPFGTRHALTPDMKTSRFVFGSGLLSAAILMTGMFGVAGAQTEGIPIALVQHAIHDPQISSSADAEASPRLKPRKAIIRARISPYFILSAGIYAAAWLDMTETQSSMPNFKEEDALVRPFLLLPKPLYYASGTMLGTGVNWLGLKMQRSERWHKIWWLPQAVSIAANLSGYGYTRTSGAGSPTIEIRRKAR